MDCFSAFSAIQELETAIQIFNKAINVARREVRFGMR